MLAIVFLVTCIVSLPPTDAATNLGPWVGVAKITVLWHSKDQGEIAAATSELRQKMKEQMKNALGPKWENAAFDDSYDSNTGTIKVTFQLNNDPVENTRAMVSLAETTITFEETQLPPIYTVENAELYYPVTRATTLCGLREIMEPCENGYLCNEDNGECERVIIPTVPTATHAPFLKYDQDTNLFIVLGIAGGLSVIFLGFLFIYCWRKGIAVQKMYRQNEKKASSNNSSPMKSGSFMM